VKTQWVKSLHPGLEVATYFGVFDISLAKTKNGLKYLKLLLGDRTGTIEARVWDPDLAEEVYHMLAPGDIAVIRGTVIEFNGLQINVEHCRKTDKSRLNLNDFRPTTEKDIPALLKEFTAKISKVANPYLKTLLETIFEPKFLEQFAHATAARKIHHCYAGGLLEHTIEVMEYCFKVIEVQGEFIDPDLLITGAAIHDLGKLWEYDQNGFTFQRTKEGRLLGGHVILGRDFLREKVKLVKNFPKELSLHLEHLILSHHGQREWGAVEEPKTLEAIALHHADLLSARINQVGCLIKNHIGSTCWTNYDRYLGRSLFVPEKQHTPKRTDLPPESETQ